ncbi:MAG TPA: hypothetical protein VNM68_05775 [Candidatus Polarisedimenticolia bacterium]|nr:hypothetical protein [Candidatus Polarisedimenticolia bacterium]
MRTPGLELLVFVGLLILAASVYAVGILSIPLNTPIKAARVRLLSLAGFLVIGALIFLGIMWPSIYSLIAALMIPSLLFLAAMIVRPKLLEGRSTLRLYLVISVAVSALCWVTEAIWLAHIGAVTLGRG